MNKRLTEVVVVVGGIGVVVVVVVVVVKGILLDEEGAVLVCNELVSRSVYWVKDTCDRNGARSCCGCL